MTTLPLILYFALQLLNTPYGSHLLDKTSTEQLVTRTDSLDCFTLVETALAQALAHQQHTTDTQHFAPQLQQLRYRHGQVAYQNRLHYFSEWILVNQQRHIIKEIQAPQSLFTQTLRKDINYMSTHPQLYPQLKAHPEWIPIIRQHEQEINQQQIRYIPKSKIHNNYQLRNIIRDGDIIAIVTDIPGLDISHVGIAIWQDNQLHLLHASSIHGKVIIDTKPLSQYLNQHPKQLGIRIIRPTYPPES